MDQRFWPVFFAPELFGDEGHDRVQQDQTLIQRPGIGRFGFRDFGFGPFVKDRFGEFEIPVAERVPYECIECIGGVIEAVVCQGRIDGFPCLGDLALDPCIERMRSLWHGGAVGHIKDAAHIAIAGRVPEFRAEVAVTCDALGVEFQRPAQTGHGRVGEPQRIRAVFIDQVQRVHHVAGGF